MQNQDYLKLLVEQLHFTTVATLGAEGSKILAAKSWTRFLKRTPKSLPAKGRLFSLRHNLDAGRRPGYNILRINR